MHIIYGQPYKHTNKSWAFEQNINTTNNKKLYILFKNDETK